MFKNYFKTAFRSLIRNRNYTIINIAGLAVGIAVCMMIFIIIQFQTSFDNFHANKDRIYRVLTEYHHADDANIAYGKKFLSNGSRDPGMKSLRRDYPKRALTKNKKL